MTIQRVEITETPARPARPGIASTRLSGFLLVVLLLVLWETSSRFGWVESRSWPAFSSVMVEVGRGLASGELLEVLASSLYRMFSGYAIGCTVGVVLGLLLGSITPLYRFINPLVETLRPIPVPAIIPPLILFLGLGDALKIFVVSFASFFPVFVNTVGGVRSVSDVMIQTAKTFGVHGTRIIFKVVLPASLPAILSGLRISLALALIVTVVAEMIAGSAGIGYYIIETQYAMLPEAMYAAVVCLAVIGYLLNRGFLRLERWLLHWYGEAQRGG